MEQIDTQGLSHREINEKIRNTEGACVLENCLGQRFLGAGMHGKELTVLGTPGNALGAYFNGGTITVHGNAQDAVGDTMNDGVMMIHGNIGDAAGYAMRGGKIFVEGNAGYRAGIHMKAYKEKIPVLVIGGKAGSFLGEYQAGGVIIVLGLNDDGLPIIGNFCGTGMHGGAIYLRCEKLPHVLKKEISVRKKRGEELTEIHEILREYCSIFGFGFHEIVSSDFFVLTPAEDPYKNMYTNN